MPFKGRDSRLPATKRDALTAACPDCTAEPGERCMRITGGVVSGRYIDGPHYRRRAAVHAPGTRVKQPPTPEQREQIARLNAENGTSWPVPATDTEARFLIDGMHDEGRRKRRERERRA